MYNNEVISPTALLSEGDGKTPGLLQILRLIFRKPALFNSLKWLYGARKKIFGTFSKMSNVAGIFQRFHPDFSIVCNISRRLSKAGFHIF